MVRRAFFGATASVRDFPPQMFSLQDPEDDIVAATRAALGDDEFSLAWAEGPVDDLEQVRIDSRTVIPIGPSKRATSSASLHTALKYVLGLVARTEGHVYLPRSTLLRHALAGGLDAVFSLAGLVMLVERSGQ